MAFSQIKREWKRIFPCKTMIYTMGKMINCHFPHSTGCNIIIFKRPTQEKFNFFFSHSGKASFDRKSMKYIRDFEQVEYFWLLYFE